MVELTHANDIIRVVRDGDHDRYLSALLAPPDGRQGLFALYAFNLELARVRETVSEPLIGRMRLQFWRDALQAIAGGLSPKHFVAGQLAAAVARHGLPISELSAMIDAREADLDSEPPADMAALLTYAEATSSALMALALRILGIDPAGCTEAVRDAGIAVALVGLVRAMPLQAALGRLSVPADLCRAAGLDPTMSKQWPADANLPAIARPMLDQAQARIAAVRHNPPPKPALSAFLPMSLASLYLKRLRVYGGDPRRLRGREPQIGRHLSLLWRKFLGSP